MLNERLELEKERLNGSTVEQENQSRVVCCNTPRASRGNRGLIWQTGTRARDRGGDAPSACIIAIALRRWRGGLVHGVPDEGGGSAVTHRRL